MLQKVATVNEDFGCLGGFNVDLRVLYHHLRNLLSSRRETLQLGVDGDDGCQIEIPKP